MNEEIKEITSSLKEILNKYPNRQLEILLYVFGRDNLMKMINEPTYEELQQENKKLKEKHYLIQGGRGNCKTYLLKLQQENQQLKEDIKDLDNQKEMMFKNMQLNQLKVCELAKVLDEIREQLKLERKLALSLNKPYTVSVIDKILDKVKE